MSQKINFRRGHSNIWDLVKALTKLDKSMSNLPDIVKDPAQLIMAAINICDNSNNVRLMEKEEKDSIIGYQIIHHMLVNHFNGDVKLARDWYNNVSQEEFDKLRVMIILGR
jgi:hypothetical protein